MKTLSFQHIITSGNIPSPRSNHTSVLYTNKESKENYLIIHGGNSDSGETNKTFSFNLKSFEWKELIIEGEYEIIPKTYHTSNIIDDYMIVFGGEYNESSLNDLSILSFPLNKW